MWAQAAVWGWVEWVAPNGATRGAKVAPRSLGALGNTQRKGEPGGSHLPGGRVLYPG